MIVPQHIQTQLYELISHRFDSIQIDRLSMDKPDWNLSITGKYSFILSVRKTHPFRVMVSEIANQKYTKKAFEVGAKLESIINENIKYG
tara:strand:+ start:84 stop:350 length:267 start_codon:yes stop_codon:yes gene_type:complete